jgi:hypothetical protein
MEKKGHTELVSSSLKLIAGEIGKRRQFFRLLAELNFGEFPKNFSHIIFSFISISNIDLHH